MSHTTVITFLGGFTWMHYGYANYKILRYRSKNLPDGESPEVTSSSPGLFSPHYAITTGTVSCLWLVSGIISCGWQTFANSLDCNWLPLGIHINFSAWENDTAVDFFLISVWDSVAVESVIAFRSSAISVLWTLIAADIFVLCFSFLESGALFLSCLPQSLLD